MDGANKVDMLMNSAGRVFRLESETHAPSVFASTIAPDNGSQSVVHGPAISASPGNLLEMLINRLHCTY